MQKIPNYDYKEVEENIQKKWDENKIYENLKKKNVGNQKFYYLDGPPYTSGKIHIGHAWGKALRDMLMRFKRMQGFDVFDRAGFDMHGLPISHKVQAKLNLKDKFEIEKFGVENFIKECKVLAKENMDSMIDDFNRLGVWMDFKNPYMPIENSYIEGIWWLIKKAHENDRLYQGLRTLTWCHNCETSLAKHELEYQNVTDNSIFVKFKIKDKDEFLVIWTTTPWTIPFNLGVMVNPEIIYQKIKVNNETWILAKDLVEDLIKNKLEKDYEILEEFTGDKLEGTRYTHPFEDFIDYPKAEKLHSVVMSTEYVDTKAGSGLVHTAPGCGPEDYEIGHKNGLPAFNTLNEQGEFQDIEKFKGLVAKKDDEKFIEFLKEKNALVYKEKYKHEYPHCERCHNPVIFRATKQWFFKIEDIKDRMKELNSKIKWVPDWAGSRQFHSWIDNLRDNSITKQIHWGTPFPVWQCDSCKEYTVVGSSKELAQLSGADKVPKDLHKPFIDKVEIPCKCGSKQIKNTDVLDVWVDAGSASWLALDYPVKQDLFKEIFPPDFILEGKDQIRGWFNLLFVAGIVSMDKPAFKAVYMHGFINDSEGRKMSKSLGNVISPYEIIEKYGADTLRYYMIGAANPGLDMNYNFDDMKVCFKNLSIYWNLHKYIIDNITHQNLKSDDLKLPDDLSTESRYILSKLNSTIKEVTDFLDNYVLNEIPKKIEELFLELSRTYIQMIRDRLTTGSDDDKLEILSVMYDVFTKANTMFAVVSPYITDAMFQNLKENLNLDQDSVHKVKWPKHNKNFIDKDLEKDFMIVQDTIQSILGAREKGKIGVRWPILEAIILFKDKDNVESIKRYNDIIKNQTNVKGIKIVDNFEGVKRKLTPNYKAMGKDFGKLVQKVASIIPTLDPNVVLKDGQEIDIDGEKKTVKDYHCNVEFELKEGYSTSEYKHGELYLNLERNDELENEGYLREIIRRIQNERKNAGLIKQDRIDLTITSDENINKTILQNIEDIKNICGCNKITFEFNDNNEFKSEFKVKEKLIKISFNKI